MPTKGIQFYTYISNPNITIKIQIGSEYSTSFSFISNTANSPIASFAIQQGNYEIGSDNSGLFSEIFSCQVLENNSTNPILTLNQSISPFTGNIGNTESDDLCNMFNTQSQIYQGSSGAKYAISYGFFDAGPGGLQITNQHQFYIYVTDVYTTWLGDLAKASNAPITNMKLCNMVVAGAHDAGMCSTATLAALNSGSSTFQSICNTMGLPFGDSIVPSSAVLQTIINMSFTQKDSYTAMLNMGVRFFDFRPGYNCVNLDNSVNHQHWVVPGDSFSNFINEVSQWVSNNDTEIVFIYLNYSGMLDAMQPINYIESYLNNQQSFNGVNIAGPEYLNNTVGDCYQSNTRIIFLNNLSNTTISNLPNATYLDSYTDDAYQTTEVQSIIQALNNTIAVSKASNTNCNLFQLQATANAAGGIASGFFSSISLSAASSVLMSTKPQFDYNTYPLMQNAAHTGLLSGTSLNVCLNDFVDNALVSNCINMTVRVSGL